jgi:hypothetical protein
LLTADLCRNEAAGTLKITTTAASEGTQHQLLHDCNQQALLHLTLPRLSAASTPPIAEFRRFPASNQPDTSSRASTCHHCCWCGAGHSRKLRVTANPNITISRAHVPLKCQLARVVLLGPLTLHDVDAGSFMRHAGVCRQARTSGHVSREALHGFVCGLCTQFARAPVDPCWCKWDLSFMCCFHPAGFWDRLLNRNQLIGLMAQGFQRDLGSAGEVLPLPAPSKQLMVSSAAGTCQQ